ncbi:hypothetical protein V8E55_008172, partial [Tylopilus felleus]
MRRDNNQNAPSLTFASPNPSTATEHPFQPTTPSAPDSTVFYSHYPPPAYPYSSTALSTPSPSPSVTSGSTSNCLASRSMPLSQDFTAEQRQQQEIQARIEDRKAAERELQRYEEDGTRSDGSGERNSDLVRFWEVRVQVT